MKKKNKKRYKTLPGITSSDYCFGVDVEYSSSRKKTYNVEYSSSRKRTYNVEYSASRKETYNVEYSASRK